MRPERRGDSPHPGDRAALFRLDLSADPPWTAIPTFGDAHVRQMSTCRGDEPQVQLRRYPIRPQRPALRESAMNTSTPTKGRPSAQETLALWKKYRETNDPALRDRLVLTFAPLVKYIVYRKVREMPARCEVEDFISCGLEALIQSIDRYDPAKGATLEQYAWTR